MTTDQAQPIARPSERGVATRAALLKAAREVFLTEGYARAGVTEIVARAGASVGSLYHHFSGKADLYLALFGELHDDQAMRTRQAVRSARQAGTSDPRGLFLVGGRAYLDGGGGVRGGEGGRGGGGEGGGGGARVGGGPRPPGGPRRGGAPWGPLGAERGETLAGFPGFQRLFEGQSPRLKALDQFRQLVTGL